MDSGAHVLRINVAILYIVLLASTLFPLSDAINLGRAFDEGQKISRSTFIRSWKSLKSLNRLNKYSNFDSYGSPSSLSIPPFNSLAPQPTPETPSPASIYPPYPSLTPTTTPTPTSTYSPIPNPPHNNFEPPSSYGNVNPPPHNNFAPPSSYGNVNPPPQNNFAPPSSYSNVNPPPHNNFAPPSSYGNVNPPPQNNFEPPNSVVNVSPPPPYGNTSPPKHSLSPPPPPPPPSPSPPPHNKRPQSAVWCVAKPTVPDPVVQEAMDYACGCGADCKLIQPNGSCYQPNTLLAHASYAFNSYWQKTKFGGGTCDFGGTAMLVTVDPSK
ncbi:hypothetical protein TanjilG_28887 [Lupinus angustifolius]|uniref:X8 domain-containing protein n=1 Tax=Lupinus angustifolius TaxID=3871 RepID=A0A1J7GMT9_LUPAN|nr:hypothetical protein TanjilG_28887 [Lupinus angustifolius]